MHAMPFGAELRADETTRFRLWAPAEPEVVLVLPGAGREQAMRRLDGGWHELVTEAPAGTAYLFRLGDGLEVPDPAARAQQDDVDGPSVVVDPGSYAWRSTGWRGRPWAEAVLYELHLGTFTPEGTCAAAMRHLPYLVDLGVTALEVMPVAEFPGARNWGYDGVLHYAPERSYGTPDELKALIDEAHRLGLMVLMDVVYNHFGPEGNFLGRYAPSFFTEDFHTPWGAAIDFRERPVRDFYIHNALYWIEEYRCDGLRLDAVHAIVDPSPAHILDELAQAVRQGPGSQREVHLVLENERNQARFLRPDGATAQWNDDVHHVYHVLLTGESAGYYADYADKPADRLARGLAEGFVYQGEPSRHQGKPRGEPSAGLPPTAFIDFLQNHDQIGNRALGERLTLLAGHDAVAACQAALLLSPHVPLLFMGDEWGATTPFLFFCDFHGELAEAVRQGRRREFAAFFENPASEVPDPIAEQTFLDSKLDWRECVRPPHGRWLACTKAILKLRADEIAPRLAAGETRSLGARSFGSHGVHAAWQLGDGSRLTLLANLGLDAAPAIDRPPGRLLHATVPNADTEAPRLTLAPWSVAWFIDGSAAA